MAATLCDNVLGMQRGSVPTLTAWRSKLARMKNQNSEPVTIGGRVKKWRLARGMTIKEMSVATGLAPTTLYDFERARQSTTTKLHLFAVALRLNVHYLQTGKGNPEDIHAQPVLDPDSFTWPFETFDRASILRLPDYQREAIEAAVSGMLQLFSTPKRAAAKRAERKKPPESH